MPVILPTDQLKVWKDPTSRVETLGSLLVPYPEEAMREWTVSTEVNKASIDHAGLIAPVA